jgi:hypothetical protein
MNDLVLGVKMDLRRCTIHHAVSSKFIENFVLLNAALVAVCITKDCCSKIWTKFAILYL